MRKVQGALLCLLLFGGALTAFAQHAGKGKRSNDEVPVNASGQQVAVDKQTGKLRQPTAEEAKQLIDGLAPLVNTSTEGLTAVRREDGSLSVDLQGRFMSVAVAKVGSDGKVEQKCVSSVAEAKEFLNSDAKDAKAKDSKAKTVVTKSAPALEER